jgi:two-component system CheB/CheR fusion protein
LLDVPRVRDDAQDHEIRLRDIPSAGAGYIVALAVTLLMFTLRYELRDVIGEFSTFLPFILGIILVAWYGGFWPGLMATVLGAALVLYFFYPLSPPTSISSAIRGVTVLVFLAIGLLTSFLCEELHAARRLLEAEHARQILADRAVRESEERFRAMAESMPSIVWTAAPDGTITYANHRWLAFCGLAPDATTRGWPELTLHPDDYRRCVEQWSRALLDGTEYEIEVRNRRYDGVYRWFMTRAVPVKDHDGRVVSWFGVTTDIHDQKELHEQLREADRRKDEFLATLAHELRNPLAPLQNAVEVMQRAGSDATQQLEARQIIGRQVRQMVRLIDDLLDVSRITRGKLELRRERIPLAAVLTDAVETSRPMLDAKRQELAVVLPPEPLDVDGDRTRLAQVFGNLLNNAAKFTEPGGRITVTAQREDGTLVVRVRDTGIGIPGDMLPRVFDIFTQVDTGPARPHTGLGIGLTIVKRVVELHGGTVEAHSEGRGRGSEFVVRLPLAAPLLVSGASASKNTEPVAAAPRRRILVVDDNEDAAKSLSAFLELIKHDVRSAHDGSEALRVGAEQHPDVVFLDIGLPDQDGYEVARLIRQQPWGRDVILVALTGWGQDEDRRRSLEAGFDLHLTKPFDPSALEQFLREPRPARAT